MGKIGRHRPVLFIAAVTSQYSDAFRWSKEKMKERFGEIALLSDPFSFQETSYYEKSMGSDLQKQFWAFEKLVDPNQLPDAKHFSNQLEDEFRQQSDYTVERPLNIDPGYITEAKLVLATTKDRDHRIYLDQGIYAEVTLYFNRGNWTSRPWTYPDYQRADFQEFFTKCRNRLREKYRESAKSESEKG